MTTDEHLGTGQYAPKTYWSARASECEGIGAVCVYQASEAENRCADKIQPQTQSIGP